MKEFKFSKRLIAMVLCLAMVMAYLPHAIYTAKAAEPVFITAADAGTADSWEHALNAEMDGNRYAGRLWADKSVYTDGQTVTLNTRQEAGSTFQVDLEDDEAFQTVFSVLGTSMTTTTTTTKTSPLDVVLILDNSDSMRTNYVGTGSNRKTRMQSVIEAANSLLEELMAEGNDVRLGITAYAMNASTVLPFGTYSNGVELRVNNYSNGGVITAYDDNGRRINSNYQSGGYQMNTNIQAGFELGMDMLKDATNIQNRKPVVILLTDGAANTARDTLFDRDRTGSVRQVYYASDIDPMIALSTLLKNAYERAEVEDHYGSAPNIYGIGVDLSNTDGSNAIINPGESFNSNNTNRNIQSAYRAYTNTWLTGATVSERSGGYNFSLGHEYPQGSAVTDSDVAANINYVDTYYPVAGANLESAFNQIYQAMTSAAFNPISTSTTVDGATGAQNTPLIYVDRIGMHMEIKELEAVTLFGASYGIHNNGDGTYSVEAATGTNPTTNESWSTADNIRISVSEDQGYQLLRIEIDQQILPILLEQVLSATVGDVTTATITEYIQDPLRVYYTVGLKDSLLLPNGAVDLSQLSDYDHIDRQTGKVKFYSNAFGVRNSQDADNDGLVDLGDAHIGFKPSVENRYYYHQANQGIFTAVKIDGATFNSSYPGAQDEYGVLYEPDEHTYEFTYLTYEDYQTLSDDAEVYTYVTYFRPIAATNDGNAAEEVTFLVYTKWEYLKESIGLYDMAEGAKVYVNYDAANGYATGEEALVLTEAQVQSVATAYKAANTRAQLVAVLGVGSLRTSRLHNMERTKQTNTTKTAEEYFAPKYTYDTATEHSGNDVVIWLGNNGVMTMDAQTGIALTKAVTETIGTGNEVYELTVTVPGNVTAAPVVYDAQGNQLAANAYSYAGNVLTVKVTAGQTVYITGIPGGTECTIGENILDAELYYKVDSASTRKVTVPTVADVLDNNVAQFAPATVTNAPVEYGNVYITKEITSTHTIPESILSKNFSVDVVLTNAAGAALANKDVTVVVGTRETTKTTDASGKITFNDVTARNTVELVGLPSGTVVTVTEQLGSDADIFTASYRSRNHSGEAADQDGIVTVPEDGNATVVITNAYAPKEVVLHMDIAANKLFYAEDGATLPGGSFTIVVQEYNTQTKEWTDIPGLTKTVTYAPGESDDPNGTGKAFPIILLPVDKFTYTQAGTWAYRVREVIGEVDNVTYDRTLYTFDVAVTDNNGQLETTVTDLNNQVINDGTYEMTFRNTFHTVAVAIDVEKVLTNNSGDPDVSKAGFAFTAQQVDNFSARSLQGNATTVYTDASGHARFTATYSSAGTYYFLVKETGGDMAPNGWTSSNAEYQVTVTVEPDSSGNLTASVSAVYVDSTPDPLEGVDSATDSSYTTIKFRNIYAPQGELDLDGLVKKSLTGRDLVAGEFSFAIYKDGTTDLVTTGTNDADGNVNFVNDISYTTAGKYQYDVKELSDADLPGVKYDEIIYDLVVEVSNDLETGELVVYGYFEDSVTDSVTFHNVYTLNPVTFTIDGLKHLHGRAMQAHEFTFELYEVVDGNPVYVTETTNLADGTFQFSDTKNAEGTYYYIVREKAGTAPGVTYDTGRDVTVTVQVTAIDNARMDAIDLAANVIVDSNDPVEFTNTYDPAPAVVTVTGTKTLESETKTLANGDFTFELYRVDTNQFSIVDKTPLQTVTNVGISIPFVDLELEEPGTYYYAVVEKAGQDADMVYDSTQHNYVVRVIDDSTTGKLNASAFYVNESTNIPANTQGNVTLQADFVNATKDEVAKKEVFQGQTQTTIDGQKVEAGQILTYAITYVNYTGKTVEVNIMDKIPEHTTYVEDSASHNGVYAGGYINWDLPVVRGETVTVTFSVKVNETEGVIPNTAQINDGVNAYHTNQVFNHTVEEELKKDVALVSAPDVSVDGKIVAVGDQLQYSITYQNVTDEAVKISIRDKIPANTTYVEGSAGVGVYADGMLTWSDVTVPALGSVNVSFTVTVNGAGVKIENTAQTLVGDNTNWIDSNKVTVETPPAPPAPPTEPTTPTTPTETPATPVTGDSFSAFAFIGMMILSSFGLAAVIVAKKREEEKENA